MIKACWYKNLFFFLNLHQGLNFTIHADAAWGGYLLTTLCKSDCKQKEEENFEDDTSEGYVPQIPLSDYVTKQYKYIRFADTGIFLF